MDYYEIAMIGVNESLRKEKLRSRIVLQVHDELLIETFAEEEEKVREIFKKEKWSRLFR